MTLADGTIAGATNDIYLYGALSGMISPAGATTVSSTLGNIYLEALTSQIAFQLPDSLVSGKVYVKATTQGGITALGNWNFSNNTVAFYETPAQDSFIDLDGNNLSCGDLKLGHDAQITYGADLRLDGGTHSIANISKAYSGTPTGTQAMNMESSTINCSGSLDFTNIALTSGTSTVNMTSSTGAKTVKAGGQTLNHLTFNDADTTWTLQDTLDVKGNLTLTAGTFTHNSRNVTISGTSGSISIIDGPFTFYNFSCTSEGKVLQFKQGETQTMTGTFTITGGAGADRVQIRSPIAGLTHTLAPAAVSVSYADIKDSTLTAERIGTNCFDSGNNTNWVLNPTFEITTPASGATLNVDSTPEIAWTSSGGITEVKLWYSTDASAGTPTWTLITPVAIANSDGANTYDWTVADAISEDCKIKVAAVLNGAVEESVLDLSDTFNIRGVLALTYPNDEGIGWPVGTARNITFTKTGTLGDVKVYCSTTGAEGDVWGEALATTSGTSYEWSPSGGHQSNNVYIKVTDADNEANVYDISDNSFTVGAGSLTAVTITDAGGDTERTTFICGNSYDIGWTTTGTVASVNISYSIDGGTNWTNIKTSVTNDDEYNGTGTGDDGPWAVENTPSANVLIKVAHSSDSNIYAVTDATTIATPFTVTTPPADIILTAGTAYVIGWTTTAGVSADTVTIEYSLTGSGSWTEINEGDYTATNDHSEVWNITAGLSTTTAKVRISDASDSTTYAYVDSSTFSLKRGSLAVTSPNSTVTWKVGTQHPIEWSTTGVINNVRLYYATDGDLETPTWNALVGGSLDDATGQYNWTIPDAISDNCLVKIVDAEDSGIFDISDAVFSIKPEFTLTAPNGGQDWAVGTTNDITWTNTGTVSQVDLQYSTNSGSTWTDIVTGLSNTGTYTWTVPTADSSNCKIKIISTSDSTVSDTSDAVFTISLASITITAPVAGNIWVRNDTNTIKWSTAGTCYDDMKIQYSPSGTFSGDVVDIATGETNDGTYSWEIPNDLTVSDTAKIRAQDMTWDTAGYDVIGTSGVFEITAPRIDLTAPNGGDTLTVAGSTDITWTSRGESIGANVEIRYSTDNFSSSTLIVDSTLDDGTYTWTDIPDDISDTVKVRVYDDSNLSIYDTSDTNLSIKGALTITSPAADATFYVGVAQDIEWTTTGTIANVDLFYSSDGGTTWKNMADLESTDEGYADSEIANDGSYSWSSPDAVNNDNTPKAISFKIVDSSDSTVYGTRDFTNSYYAATLNVTDLAGLVGHLRALAVTINYSSTGLTFGDFTGVVSPATQYFTPNVQFSVEVSRNGYLAGSTNFLADENDKTINIALDAAAINKERTVEIEHYYRPSTDMLYLNARLREQENLIPKNDEDNSIVGVTEFYVQIFDGNTEVLTSTTATTTLNTTGEFLAVWEDVRADGYLEEGTRYSARVRAEYEGTYHWNMNIIDITEAMTMYRINRAFGMSDADMLSGGDSIVSRLTASTTSLATTVASQATLTKAAVTASASTTQAAITAGTASTATAITTSQSTIASAVTSSQSSITSAVTKQASARIINEYTNFEAGDTFQIRYRTTSGITCTVSIYDADEETVVSAASMSEVGTTGIYTYDFETDDEGLYSIVCSGSNGTTDVIAVAAISADLETISSNITAVMGSVSGIDTASLASAAATIATLESSLATLSGALGGLTSMASEVDSISSELNQSISSALANISKAFDNVTSQVGVDLGNMGKIVEEGKSDRKYIQEKQEEVKAGVDLVRDIIEQGNDAPVQTTWMVSSETAEMDTGIIETIEE